MLLFQLINIDQILCLRNVQDEDSRSRLHYRWVQSCNLGDSGTAVWSRCKAEARKRWACDHFRLGVPTGGCKRQSSSPLTAPQGRCNWLMSTATSSPDNCKLDILLAAYRGVNYSGRGILLWPLRRQSCDYLRWKTQLGEWDRGWSEESRLVAPDSIQ